jgi:hypothetical protein
MTGNRHNREGNSSDGGEPGAGPYWKRMHRDWRFWIGAVFMFAAISIYVLSGDLAWVPRGHRQPALQVRRIESTLPAPLSDRNLPARTSVITVVASLQHPLEWKPSMMKAG